MELVMAYDQNFMDALALVGFIVGIANYNENLSQSDKDDIMEKLDNQTKELLEKIQAEIKRQNRMLEEILERLE